MFQLAVPAIPASYQKLYTRPTVMFHFLLRHDEAVQSQLAAILTRSTLAWRPVSARCPPIGGGQQPSPKEYGQAFIRS